MQKRLNHPGITALQIIVNDNSDEFKQEILRRLTEYHREQLQAISLPGSSGNVSQPYNRMFRAPHYQRTEG
jgi:hypothetical protein